MKALNKIIIAIIFPVLMASGCAKSSEGPFLKPVLKDKEQSVYKLTTSSGVVGKAVFRVAKDKRSPYGFVFTNTGKIPSMLDSLAISRVKPDLLPISTNVIIKNPGGTFTMKARYEGNKLSIDSFNQPTKTIEIVEPTYDFGEFLMLLRSLKFKVGAKYKVNEAWPSFGQVFVSQITVKGIEKIKVPAGEFRVYHVTHTFGEKTERGQTIYNSWYEKASPHRLIKHDTRTILYELSSSS